MKSNKVYSIDVRPSFTQSSSLFPAHAKSWRRKKKTFGKSLMKSRASYKDKLDASNQALNKILLERKSSYSLWYLLYAILGPLATFLMNYGAFVLWPMKNVFTHPDTW